MIESDQSARIYRRTLITQITAVERSEIPFTGITQITAIEQSEIPLAGITQSPIGLEIRATSITQK